jgi:hypothetical protein
MRRFVMSLVDPYVDLYYVDRQVTFHDISQAKDMFEESRRSQDAKARKFVDTAIAGAKSFIQIIRQFEQSKRLATTAHRTQSQARRPSISRCQASWQAMVISEKQVGATLQLPTRRLLAHRHTRLEHSKSNPLQLGRALCHCHTIPQIPAGVLLNSLCHRGQDMQDMDLQLQAWVRTPTAYHRSSRFRHQ